MARPLHLAANLTWECQLRCACCWIDDLGLKREGHTRAWTEWRDGLMRFGQSLLIDFSGGEPLLFPGFHKLVTALSQAGVEWAITTNMIETAVVKQFLAMPVPGCVSWNLSYHAAMPTGAVDLLRQLQAAGYPVAVNAVLHPTEPLPGLDCAGLPVNWIPWQDWTKGDGTDNVPRLCNAGQQHVVCAPDGTAYRCQVELQKQMTPLGNLVDGTVRSEPSTHLCLVGCSTCYTQNGMAAAGWRVSMEVATP